MKKEPSILTAWLNYFGTGVYLLLSIICLVSYLLSIYLEKSYWVLIYEHLRFSLMVCVTIITYRDGNRLYKEYYDYKEKEKVSDTKELLND